MKSLEFSARLMFFIFPVPLHFPSKLDLYQRQHFYRIFNFEIFTEKLGFIVKVIQDLANFLLTNLQLTVERIFLYVFNVTDNFQSVLKIILQ